jgi:protein tyrosine/serine phosphatase
MEINPLPIYNSYWVIPDRFRAGEYPGSILDDDARTKLRWLIDQGTNFILDLTFPGEYDLKPYDQLFLEEARKINKSVIHKRLPIQDLSTPTQDEMVGILDTIESALSAGENIYLHCFGGKGRTGLVVGCYLARHGMSGEKSLEKIQELRKGLPDAAMPSPETDEQRRMVKEWIKGQ